MTSDGGWHIDSLSIKNFRGFEKIELDFDPSLTVLVGINGSGKTAILDAIAVSISTVLREFDGHTRGFERSDVRLVPKDLHSQRAVAHMQPEYPVSTETVGTLAGNIHTWSRVRQKENGRSTWSDRDPSLSPELRALWEEYSQDTQEIRALPVIALYGVERLVAVRRASGEIPQTRSGAYEAALDGKSDLSRLSTFLKDLTESAFLADRRGEPARAVLAQIEAITLASNLLLEETGWRDPEWNPLVKAISLSHPDRGTLPLASLSSGTKIATGLIIDLVSRMARANPHLGAKELLIRVPGIVLIDEIELHLHPTWQQRILPRLKDIFPRVQFIVTTHSPQVLSSISANSIRIIDGETVRRTQFSAGLRSDIVLKNILGATPEPELPVNKKLDQYMQLVKDGKGEIDEVVKLRQKLDDELGGVANVPKLADADAEITLYDMDF